MKEFQNLVGPEVRKVRNKLGWSQEQLAAQLNLQGWDISRGTLSKIEAQLRCVTDAELLLLARVFKVGVEVLFSPAVMKRAARSKGRV